MKTVMDEYTWLRSLAFESERAITLERVIVAGSALYADRKEVCIAARNLALISELTWPSMPRAAIAIHPPTCSLVGARKALSEFRERERHGLYDERILLRGRDS